MTTVQSWALLAAIVVAIVYLAIAWTATLRPPTDDTRDRPDPADATWAPVRGDVPLYLVTDDGAYRTDDAGETWVRVYHAPYDRTTEEDPI